MLKDLFERQQGYINHFFDQLNLEQAEEMLKILLDCTGALFFTGVGKSGFIAEKLAMTMVSVGVRSWFVPPTNALHGDLGIVGPDDVVIFLSKSGESDELLQLIPFVRNKGATTLAWVSKEGSRLEQACDQSIFLPLERELCPFDMAPTTSASIQLLFGDVLAVAMMNHRKFSLDDYAKNHPAGRIGKRITLKVSDVMLSDGSVPTCRPDEKLVDQLAEFSDKQCGCLLVVDENKELQGIFTDGDLRRALQEHGPSILEKKLDDLMTRKCRHVEPDRLAVEAMEIMEMGSPITILPVLEKGKVSGLIKMHDIVQSGL